MWTTASAKALRWERARKVPLWQRECMRMCGAESRETAVGNEVRKITERPQCAGL